jgi:N-hydroxyarylamine O-acetyltransferase
METLRGLCTAHIHSVPFENFGVIAKESIELKEELLFNKIVTKRRGGICYELNVLFRWLLESLGYDVILLTARIFDKKTQEWAPERVRDHLTLSVALPGQPDERYLTDVGTPGLFGAPLRLVDGASQRHGNYDIRLRLDTGTWYLERKGLDVWPDLISPAGPARVFSQWEKSFQLTLQQRELGDFTEAMIYQQTSPEGPLTQGNLAVITSKDGG